MSGRGGEKEAIWVAVALDQTTGWSVGGCVRSPQAPPTWADSAELERSIQ